MALSRCTSGPGENRGGISETQGTFPDTANESSLILNLLFIYWQTDLHLSCLNYTRTASSKWKQGFWQADYSFQHNWIITLKYRVIFNINCVLEVFSHLTVSQPRLKKTTKQTQFHSLFSHVPIGNRAVTGNFTCSQYFKDFLSFWRWHKNHGTLGSAEKPRAAVITGGFAHS